VGSYTWKSEIELEYVSDGGQVSLLEKAWQTLGVEVNDYSLSGYLSGSDINDEQVEFDQSGLIPQLDEPRFILRGHGKLEDANIQVTSKPGRLDGGAISPRDNFVKDITDIIVDIRSTTGKEKGELSNFPGIKETADSLHLILKIPEDRMLTFVTDLRHGSLPSLSVAFHAVLFAVKHDRYYFFLPVNRKPRTPAALNYVSFTYKRPNALGLPAESSCVRIPL